MVENEILNRVFLALSREKNISKVSLSKLPKTFLLNVDFFSHLHKTYVQNLIMKECGEIYNLIKHQQAHVYVCGDVQMAENVYQTLR